MHQGAWWTPGPAGVAGPREGSPTAWSQHENGDFGSLWQLSVLVCAMLREGSSTACCSDALLFHQVFGSAFNTLFQEICQERANILVIYRPSYGLPYYCLESIRADIYVLLWPFLPAERTQILWFSTDLPVYSSWEDGNKKRIPEDPQRKKHFSLIKRSTVNIHNWQRKRFCGLLSSFVMGMNQTRYYIFFCHLSSGW